MSVSLPGIGPRRGPRRGAATAILAAVVLLVLVSAFMALLPRGAYDGDFEGNPADGRAYGWDAWNSPSDPTGVYRCEPGAERNGQTIDLRDLEATAGVSTRLNDNRAGTLTLQYRTFLGGTAAATPSGGFVATSTSWGQTQETWELPRAEGWHQLTLRLAAGDRRLVVVAAYPGWCLTVDNVVFRPERPSVLDEIRERLWGRTGWQPAAGGRLDLVEALSMGSLGEMLPPLTLFLLALIAAFTVLLLSSYPLATVVLFALASVVSFEPAPFDVLLAVWVVYGLSSGRFDWRRLLARRTLWILAGAAALGLATLVSWSVGSRSPASTEAGFITLYCLGLFVGLWAARDPGALSRHVSLGLVAGGLLGLAACLAGLPYAPHLTHWGGEWQGLFKDSNVFGPSLYFPALLALFWAFRDRRPWLRVLWLAVGLALAVGMVLSGSRAAVGGFALALVVAGVALIPRLAPKRRRLVAAAGMAVLLALGLAAYSLDMLGLRLYDFTSRLPAVQVGLLAIPQAPLGYGPSLAPTSTGVSPHNLFVLVAVEYGWVGGIGVTALLAALLIGVWRRLRSQGLSGPDLITAAALAGLVGYLANSMVVSTLHWRHLWILVGLLAAALAEPLNPGGSGLAADPHPASETRREIISAGLQGLPDPSSAEKEGAPT